MKYCQKCKAMLQDDVEICPICNEKQLSAEDLDQKKRNTVLSRLLAVIIVIVVVAAALSAIMVYGKEPERSMLDEEYTENVTDPELIAQFASYVATALPQVWAGTEEEIDYAIEYYQTSFPEVAEGYEQIKEIRPVSGDVKTVTLDGAVKSEEGNYKLLGQLICTNRKVNYELVLAPSAYVDGLSFSLKEETPLQKAREFLINLVGD